MAKTSTSMRVPRSFPLIAFVGLAVAAFGAAPVLADDDDHDSGAVRLIKTVPIPTTLNALQLFGAEIELKVEKELGPPRDRTNVDGGAIAVGHPLAASGARITAHLIHELRRRGARYGLGGACIGGGQGIGVIVEALS